MSAAEYWTPLEHLLSDAWGDENVADLLVTAGFVAADKRDVVADLLACHQDTYAYDDSDRDSRCECGKWLEDGHFELPDHQSAVLDDAGLILLDGNSEEQP